MLSQGWLLTEALEARGPGQFPVPGSQELEQAGTAGAGAGHVAREGQWPRPDFQGTLDLTPPFVYNSNLCSQNSSDVTAALGGGASRPVPALGLVRTQCETRSWGAGRGWKADQCGGAEGAGMGSDCPQVRASNILD